MNNNSMKKYFIFDVDGTLTLSRQKIDDNFYTFFLNFCRNNVVFLATGSDKEKTVEQLTEEVYNSCHTVFNCLGNDIWRGNDNVYTSNWKIPPIVHEALSFLLGESEFPYRTGLHFDHRPGLCNFSVVGRNATLEQRKEYVEWDKKTYERIKIANAINDMFPSIEARIGGETGLDVIERGRDKSQIINQFPEDAKLYFFGDKMSEGGNDYTLSQAVKQRGGELFHVKDYKDTWDILKNVI